MKFGDSNRKQLFKLNEPLFPHQRVCRHHCSHSHFGCGAARISTPYLNISCVFFVFSCVFLLRNALLLREKCVDIFFPLKSMNCIISVACRGKSCHLDDCYDKCHEWSEECCRSVSAYAEKLSLQCERKRERKAKSSSFSSFSPSVSVPLGQLSSADSASSAAVCAMMFTVAVPAVTTAPVTSTPAVMVTEHPCKSRRVTDPKEWELMFVNFEDWWASGRSTQRLGLSSASLL